jgi:hypothetical protein
VEGAWRRKVDVETRSMKKKLAELTQIETDLDRKLKGLKKREAAERWRIASAKTSLTNQLQAEIKELKDELSKMQRNDQKLPSKMAVVSTAVNSPNEDEDKEGKRLTGASVELDNNSKSAPTNIRIKFTIAKEIPVDGNVIVEFPSPFTPSCLSDVCLGGIEGIDGGLTTTRIDMRKITLVRTSDGSAVPGNTEITVVLTKIKTPSRIGNTGVFCISTKTKSGSVIEINTEVAGVEIVDSSKLGGATVEFSDCSIAAVTTATIRLRPSTEIPADGKIVVDFPCQFSPMDGQGGAGVGSVVGMDGGITVLVDDLALVLVLLRDGKGTPVIVNTELTIMLDNLQMPGLVGETGAFGITTQTSTGVILQTDRSVKGPELIMASTAVNKSQIVEISTARRLISAKTRKYLQLKSSKKELQVKEEKVEDAMNRNGTTLNEDAEAADGDEGFLEQIGDIVSDRIAGNCPLLDVDLPARRIYLKEMINFWAGTADIKPQSYSIVDQLQVACSIINSVVGELGLMPLHLRVEGHVHKV